MGSGYHSTGAVPMLASIYSGGISRTYPSSMLGSWWPAQLTPTCLTPLWARVFGMPRGVSQRLPHCRLTRPGSEI
ncbi:unnamed protein product [Symbiodinium pilosum]|uniref:Uncharacterized protein n=1 Tax=Symbiodinium pilosum TaxID=2952 RepID=A0A812UIJ0_SYMPI|nr:unnamed protein product [Symbiodinium pilosum]